MMERRFLTLLLALWGVIVQAQQQGMDALRIDYPQLMEKFGSELEQQRADYFFLVDVSGTMQNYKEIVVPALQEFFRSLQADDYVSVIKFGGAAKNDIGSQGKVNDGVKNNLMNYAPHLYDIPNNAADKTLYFSYTDLAEMLKYLAGEMHMPGLNKLKFVFIITDFVHDPTAAKKGNENWEAIKRQLANEQSGNYLYAFALQLPGNQAGRDLDKVTGVFPVPIEIQQMQDKEALSEWFSHKKNRILLDKFTALVKTKRKDPSLSIKPAFTNDGYLTLHTSWTPNELYSQLSVDEVILSHPDFTFKSFLPVTLNGAQGEARAGKVSCKTIWRPLFYAYGDSLTVRMSLIAPYTSELLRLGIAPQPIVYTLPAKAHIFTFLLPFWVTVVLAALIALYFMAVIRAFRRNRLARYKINGTFSVRYQGQELCRKKAAGLRKADIGNGAVFLAAIHEHCNWLVEIRTATYSCFRIFKKPAYRVFMLKGSRFVCGGQKYMKMHHPLIARGGAVNIDDFAIKWIP